MTAVWGGGVQMVIYLEDDATRERADAISGALQRLPALQRLTVEQEVTEVVERHHVGTGGQEVADGTP